MEKILSFHFDVGSEIKLAGQWASASQVSGQVPLPIGACPQLIFELEITMSISQESF